METAATCNTDMLKEIFARGLVSGIGNTEQTCIEGAIALACGLPLTDAPPCVAKPDREFAIRLNDARWSSPQARSEALLPLALAQIGTAGTDRRAWLDAVIEGTIRKVVPAALRAAARVQTDPAHAEKLEAMAIRCEKEGTRDAAAAANAANAYAAANAAYAAANAAYAAANAAYAAANAAYAAANDVLRIAVGVALDAYAAEGRHKPEQVSA